MLTEAKTDLVRNSAIAGMLQGLEHVNRINAATVAEERGIRVHEEKQNGQRGGAATMIAVELHSAAGTSTPPPPSFTASNRASLSSTAST